MDFLPHDLTEYIEAHTAPESSLLAKLNRETNAKIPMARMLSGHLQGQVLTMFSHMIQPRKVLEIGTFTGYSAICLAAGLQQGGMIHTIDNNDELEPMVRKYLHEAGMENKITYHVGEALSIIPAINEMFDLVFIDADKINYAAYYDLVFDKVRAGGYIIADNVLWSGKVIGRDNDIDPDTQGIIDFNNKVQNDERVHNVLFPIRDGLMVVRKG